MQFAIYNTQTGQITRIISCHESVAASACRDNERFLATTSEISDDTHYVENENFVIIPAKPDGHVQWEPETKQWVESPELASVLTFKKRAQLLSMVERARIAKITAPLSYDGRNIDANDVSQRNISAKVAELNAREELNMPLDASQLIWKDADNQMISFQSQTEYKNWLMSILIAITDRGTQSYVWSWQKKAEIEAAQTLAELNAISLD